MRHPRHCKVFELSESCTVLELSESCTVLLSASFIDASGLRSCGSSGIDSQNFSFDWQNQDPEGNNI